MEHAARLDLEQFESSDQQDRLERARRQVTGRDHPADPGVRAGPGRPHRSCPSRSGLVAYAPWLIVLILLALVPAFLGEVHFNALGYRLNYFRTPERRQLDYIRYLGSSVETAKEVKLFGLNAFLVDRFEDFAERMLADNRQLAIRRAAWGGACSRRSASCAYYLAYAVIVWRTVAGRLQHRRPHLPGRLVPAPARPARGPAPRVLADRRTGAVPGGPVLVLRDPARRSARPRPGPDSAADPVGASSSRTWASATRRSDQWAVRHLNFTLARRGGAGARRRERRRQDDDRQAAGAALRPDGRAASSSTAATCATTTSPTCGPTSA